MVKLQTVGKILKETREKKKLSIEEVAEGIKIKEEYLVALENDDYHNLPSLPFIQGFIKNYARFLNLEPKKLLAIFRRDFKNPVQRKILPEGLTNSQKKFSFTWMPKMTVIMLGVMILALIGFYLFWQYRSLMEAPYFKP